MNRLFNPLCAAPIFVGMLCCGWSLAADAPPGTQEWFRGQNTPMTPPPAQGGGADFGQPNVPPMARLPQQQNTGSDFPGDLAHDWVIASARFAYSRATFHRLERELDNTVRMAQFTFEQSHDYQEAVAAEKRAYDAFVAERQRALQSVVKDPKYIAALELRDKTGEKIATLRAKFHELPRDVAVELASVKLQFASDAHAMEAEALERDDALKAARQRMVEANAKVAALRTGFDNSVRTNPQILQARRDLEDARVAFITAEAYLNASTIATGLATDFTFYRHRWDGVAAPQFGWVGPGPFGY